MRIYAYLTEFQFLLVRLRAFNLCCQWPPVCVFQFLLVRLRDDFRHFFKNYLLFQFLLVRLRGRSQFVECVKCSISIPSGAIKSTSVPALSTTITEFQFLLVRLRAEIHSRVAEHCWISIPSGAIKSVISQINVCLTFSFQFLLVRLRGFAFRVLLSNISNFNSFWCD